MSALEQLVRPFQLPTVTPPKRVMETEKPVEDVLVSFGKAGSGKTFIYEIFLYTNFEVKDDDKTHVEVSRKEVIKRVINPEDTDQYVDVNVMKELTVRRKTNPKEYKIYEFNEA